MKVKLKYLGISTSSYAEEIELSDGATVGDLLHHVKDEIEDSFERVLGSGVVLVNKSKADLDTCLANGDEVMVMYILGGG